jgi:hypothetical protein
MKLSLNRFQLSLLFGITLSTLPAASSLGQASSPKDISFVYAHGKINGQEYTNDYFGLTLAMENVQFTRGAFVSSNGKRARLVDAEATTKKPEEKYEIAVLADLLTANPLIRSPEQYIQAVRHGLEKEGLVTVSGESPTEISGIHFVSGIMRESNEKQGYYRGIYTTFLNGYILSIDVTAASPERLTKIVQGMVHFKN